MTYDKNRFFLNDTFDMTIRLKKTQNTTEKKTIERQKYLLKFSNFDNNLVFEISSTIIYKILF